MQHPTPPYDDLHGLDAGMPQLPTLALPPVPFSRSSNAATPDTMPIGTSVNDLLGALTLDGLDGLDATAHAPVTHEAPAAAEAAPRPHHEFSVDINRRGVRDRRAEQRSKPDRRSFTSEHLAAPEHGPQDPRPIAPPTAPAATRATPIDAVMPELPLEPARAYQLPNSTVAASTRRDLRATPPFTMAPAPQPQAQPLPQQPAPAGTTGIASIFNAAAPVPVGHLNVPEPTPAPAPASAPASATAMHPAAAAAAANPAAWYDGAAQVDDALMIWNAPGTAAPLAPSVSAMIAPTPLSAPAAASAPTPAASAASAASGRAGRAPASRLRVALMIAVPALAGTGVAVAIDRLLL